jgi:hypothetical protein
MKKLLYILLLLPSLVFGQSGEGYINYKSYKTHYGNGSSSTYNGVSYSGGANSTAEFDAMVDTNQPGTTLTHSGEVSPLGSTGLAGGLPPRWGNDYYAIVYSGWFKPDKTGTYNIRTYADDASETRYREVGTTTWQTMTYQWGCCTYVYGTATLDNTKWYEFEFRYQEYSGGAYYNFEYSIPEDSSSPIYNRIRTNYPFGTWTNIEPTQELIDPSVDFQFEFNSNMEPDKIKYGIYYDNSTEQDGSDFWNTTTTTLPYLDSDGTTDVTDYLHLDKLADGKRATTTGGNVEWCVVYDYDTTNKRYRVGIDKREFPSGFTFTDLKQLKLFDLWDGGITYMSDDSSWANYYIYTDTQFDFTSSTFSSYIRDANGFYGMKTEFSFEDVEIYKKHRLLFVHAQDLWNPQLFIDDYVTVADVVSAFSELSGGGINGGYKGDLNGVQLQNADVNQDGNFDFQDTFKLLRFLQGEENFPTYQRTSDIMRVIPKSEYDGTTTSNWKTQPNKGLKSGVEFDLIYDSIQQPQYKVTFLGDVNLSHSPSQTGASPAAQSTISSRMMSVRNSSTQKNASLEVDLDIEKTNENIIVTLCIPENNFNIIGSEFRIGFDNTRLIYDKMETSSSLSNFDVQRTEYVKVGSISTDGSKNLNGGVEYKLHFRLSQSIESILGLTTIIKSELVLPDGTQIESIIK